MSNKFCPFCKERVTKEDLKLGYHKSACDKEFPKDFLKKSSNFFFRANLQRTGSFRSKGLKNLSGLKWKYKTNGEIIGSPIIADNTVYFGSCDKIFYAVDLKTGKCKWQYPTNGNIMSSPALSQGKVFFGSNDKNFYALDVKTGNLKWKQKTNGKIYSSPSIFKGIVFFGSFDKNFYALDIKTGEEIWKFETQGKLRYSSSILNETVLLSSFQNKLYAVDYKTGEEVWSQKAIIESSPIMDRDRIYFKGRNIFALDIESKNIVWKFNVKGLLGEADNLAIYKNTLYFGINKYLYAIDAKSGKKKWSLKVKGYSNFTLSIPSIADDTLYIGNSNGNMYSVDLSTREINWKFSIRHDICTAPFINDGIVVFGSNDEHIYALS